jgi:two-component system sensor histidine kinase NreB
MQVHFKHTGLEQRFSGDIEITVYRVVQEALINAANYAGVDEVNVRLLVGRKHLDVQIEDQGRGFDAQEALHNPATSGLSGMRERTRLLGGDLQIDSEPGRGSFLTVYLPLPATDGGSPYPAPPASGAGHPLEFPRT